MARYFFNVVDGTRIDDDEGQNLADLDAARLTAIHSARRIMGHEIWSGRLPLNEVIEITDPTGRVLLIVPFKEAVQIIG